MAQTMFAGTLKDPTNLAAVGLASTFCAIMILSLIIGLNSAQETLTSQAFGAGNLRLCGLYLNRGHLVIIVFFVPVSIVTSCYGESVFLLMGQDEELSRLTAIQIQALLPSVFFYGHYDLRKRWMACQRITVYPMVAMLIASVLYIPLCYIFFFHFDLGILGLAVATSIKDGVLLLAVMVYSWWSPQLNQVLQPLDSESFRGWGEYLWVSLPTTVMICSEWWAYEIFTVIAATLGVNQLAAQVITNNVAMTLWMVPCGIS